MRIPRAAAMWLVLILACIAPAAAQKPFTATTSVHFIRQHADATAVTLQLSEGINPDLSASLEVTRIDEDPSTLDLAAARLSKRLGRRERPQIWAFGGVRYISGENPVFGDFDDAAVQVGVSTSLALRRLLRLDGSAGFSFFERTLTELEAAVSRQVSQDSFVSAGYKSYIVSGDSIGGVIIGVTWRR